MSLSRRNFLSGSATFGALSSVLAHPELALALDAALAKPAGPPTAGETYWKNLYASEGERSRSSSTPDSSRDPRIAQYDTKAGLRWADEIKDSELPVFLDSAVITMEISGFRPGSQDKSQLSKVRFAQLHLSCQRVSGSEFLGPIVWAALATLFTNKASSLPAEQSLTWSALAGGVTQQSQSQQGQPQMSNGPQLTHIVLNDGAGHMSINVTSTPTTSLLDKILGAVIEGTQILSPLLGFPGIALPALQNFYTFYGQLERSRPENFLLNSEQQDVVVTQKGTDNTLISASALKLVSGTYFLVPKAQEADLEKDMDKLVISNNSYLVERNAKGTPDDLIAQAVPTVSYVALNVRVQSASDFPATSTVTDPLLDAAPSGAGSSGGKSAATKKPQ
jgi:hypothetical protein